MSWDPELDVQCQTPVQWSEALPGGGGRTAKTYAAPRTVRCFIAPAASQDAALYRDPLPRWHVVMPPFDVDGVPILRVSTDDKFVLPTAYGTPFNDPLQPPAKAAHPTFDHLGELHHFEITL